MWCTPDVGHILMKFGVSHPRGQWLRTKQGFYIDLIYRATLTETGNTVFLRRHLSSGSSRQSEGKKRFEGNVVEDGERGSNEGHGGEGFSTGGVDIPRSDGYPGPGRGTRSGSRRFSQTMAKEESRTVDDLPLGTSMDEDPS